MSRTDIAAPRCCLRLQHYLATYISFSLFDVAFLILQQWLMSLLVVGEQGLSPSAYRSRRLLLQSAPLKYIYCYLCINYLMAQSLPMDIAECSVLYWTMLHAYTNFDPYSNPHT